MNASLGRVIGWCFVIVVVSNALSIYVATRISENSAAEQAATVYENQVDACEQANPLRESVVLAIRTASQTATPISARAQYADALNRQLHQPFIRSDGSKECAKAVKRP